jgi:uncharacterized membrane protein YphA (DoxX/SURF4 family)
MDRPRDRVPVLMMFLAVYIAARGGGRYALDRLLPIEV